MENQQNSPLQALRDEIDKIDNQLISLLDQRMEIITRVGELKKNNQEKFFIRANREADMIKELVRKVGPHFPKSAVVNIWRKIIAAANMHEQPLRLGIHNPKNISDYSYLVREYYNDTVPLHMFDAATNVVGEMEKNQIDIGIFALPVQEEALKKEDAKENWWISLANNRLGLKVFAKIPFVEFVSDEKIHDKIQLVTVAAKQPEKSSDDSTLLYIELPKEISKTQILSALKEQNLNGKILKSVQLHQVEGIAFHLVELQGFYLETDEIIKNFIKSKIKPFTKILGHYANPIKI